MCGLVGVLSRAELPIHTDCLVAMCDAIAHRGPDDAGYLLGKTGHQHPRGFAYFKTGSDIENQHHWNLFLGHRRLAILDPSPAGHQPMSDITQSVWVVYNGEIYNFKQLRSELVALGYEFVTNTDTEVLIYAYQQWGIDCIQRFNGMFAFALWDKTKQQLFLARDRYGIKPLYYTQLPNGKVIFASEIKAMLPYPDFKVQLDKQGLFEYFTFQNFFTDRTLYNDVKLLPAASYIQIPLMNPNYNLQTTQYWDFSFAEENSVRDQREYAAELAYLFEQAVERQLVSDVEVGSYLSGGMDSGSITAVAAKHKPYLKTFTVGFDLNNISGMELAYDEREKAEHLSYLHKTEHYEMVLKSGDMERCLPKFAWHLEEPRVGQSYPNYYAAKLAGKFVKVVLSGAGGDELFAGYPWRYYRAVNNDDFEHYAEKYYAFWQRMLSDKDRQALFAPIWSEVAEVDTREIFKQVFKSHANDLQRPEDYVNHSLYFEIKTFLHGLLVVEDKLSMAHSLETRVPFLDNDLVDFSLRIPVNLKLGNLQQAISFNENEIGNKSRQYFNKTNDGKLILRKALTNYMPEQVLTRVKQGFSSPDKSWFKRESQPFIQDTLLNPKAKINCWMDSNVVQRLVGEHLNAVENRRLLVWSLLNIEQWCEQYGLCD